MNGSNKVGILLLVLIAGWIVIYYLALAPVARQATGSPEDGLNLKSSDTFGASMNSPDQERQQPQQRQTGSNQSSAHSPDPAGTTPAVTDSSTGPGTEETKINRAQPSGTGADASHSGAGASGQATDTSKPLGPQTDPHPTQAPLSPPPPPKTTPYIVQKGDTMESIAQAWFGDKDKWVLISHENPYVDPLKMKKGITLRLPAKDASLKAVPLEELSKATSSRSYTVVQGDSLWKIAEKFYNNGTLHKLIFDANRSTMKSEDDLQIGMQLIIPPHQEPAD